MTSRLPLIALVLAISSSVIAVGAVYMLSAMGGFYSPFFIVFVGLIWLGLGMSLTALVLAGYSLIRHRSVTAYFTVVLCMTLYTGWFVATETPAATSRRMISFDPAYGPRLYHPPTMQLRVLLVVLGITLPPVIGLFWRRGGQVSLRTLLTIPVLLAIACMLVREDLVHAWEGRLSFGWEDWKLPIAAAAVSALVIWTAVPKPLVERSESSTT